jgi:hypothetical protein
VPVKVGTSGLLAAAPEANKCSTPTTPNAHARCLTLLPFLGRRHRCIAARRPHQPSGLGAAAAAHLPEFKWFWAMDWPIMSPGPKHHSTAGESYKPLPVSAHWEINSPRPKQLRTDIVIEDTSASAS